jgi:sugar lactone lactonase YvrE
MNERSTEFRHGREPARLCCHESQQAGTPAGRQAGTPAGRQAGTPAGREGATPAGLLTCRPAGLLKCWPAGLLKCWPAGLLAFAALALSPAAPPARAQTVDSVITNLLSEPNGVAVDGANNIYVSDSAHNRIVKLAADSNQLLSLSGAPGQSGSTDGVGILARFNSPEGIVVARGGLVVADSANHTIRFVTLTGTASTLAGTPQSPGLADGAGATAQFSFPIGLAAAADGNVFIADSKNNAIRKLDLGNVVSTIPVAVGELFEPAGLAIGDEGNLWVADTRKHTVKLIKQDGTVLLRVGSDSRWDAGSDDSLFAAQTRFNRPAGVLWLGAGIGLLVTDSGNHTLRRIFFNSLVGDYSSETLAGTPGESGFVDGPAATAKFSSPTGLARDPINGGFLICDLANNAVRRVQTTAPQPPVREPKVGWVDFVEDDFGNTVSVLRPVTQAVFNNEVIIAVLSEPATETYFTFGPTPASSFEDHIPVPSRTSGNTPPAYEDGLAPSDVPPSMIGPQPDVTIKAVSLQDGRRPSQLVTARFQFKTANPSISGDNPASFALNNETTGAEMWFTTDGTEPTNDGSNPASAGPKFDGDKVSLPLTDTNIIFKVRAFRQSFLPSGILTKEFSPTNFVPNQISFGFEFGEASSEFVGAAGQRFYAPVTLTIIPGQQIYSLQFNVTVTNVTGPVVAPGAIGFQSMLKKPIEGVTPVVYTTIPNAMALHDFAALPSDFTNLLATNFTENLIAVGWLERFGKTNLFNTVKQDLITFSIAHDTLFESKNNKVILGGYSFVIPSGAADGETFQIQLGRPSGTEDGVARDIFIDAPTNGSLAAGPINAIKVVTVGQRRYVVGDVAPFRWFNAGDFGDTNLLNNDVLQVFEAAIYDSGSPPAGSDFFDAMDSSDATINPALLASDGSDTEINNVKFGDGVLDVSDIYVTFRRSLDPALTWYARFWAGGVRDAIAVTNVFRQPTNVFPARPSISLSSENPPAVTFSAGAAEAAPGETVEVPVQARISGGLPVRVMMMNLTVKPLGGAPPLEQAVHFQAVPALGAPTYVRSIHPGNLAAAWLDNRASGVRDTSLVGVLKVAIPAAASTSAAYAVEFDHFSASPNGLGVFPVAVESGLITLKHRPVSPWNDAIPDAWRLSYFGSVTSPLSDPNGDPDGDGMSNLAEYKAGTDPMKADSALRVMKIEAVASGPGEAPMIALRWPTVAGKRYIVERSPSLDGAWTPLGEPINGDGQPGEFVDPTVVERPQFYRLRLAE